MKIQDALTTRAILREELEAQWPIMLLKAAKMSGALFRQTHWVGSGGTEASFVRRLAFPAAVYFQMRDMARIGKERALRIVERMTLDVGCREQWSHMKSMRTAERSGMARLMAFHDLMDEWGAPRFNTRIYKEKTDSRCHFVISRCVFMDFFTEVGAPELTKCFCKVDRRFFPDAFPDFKFHRGDSWENKIAYGKSQCEFVFEKKTTGRSHASGSKEERSME
jgi:hypothetical protein